MTSSDFQKPLTALRINHDKIAHETVDDEVIIIHLDTGTYYNLVDVALDIWRGVESGASCAHIATTLAQAYGITPEASRQAMDGLLTSLLAEEILIAVDDASPSVNPFLLADRSGRPFTVPELSIHTNMSDLLLLDPIHDVDEQGWPSASPRDPVA